MPPYIPFSLLLFNLLTHLRQTQKRYKKAQAEYSVWAFLLLATDLRLTRPGHFMYKHFMNDTRH